MKKRMIDEGHGSIMVIVPHEDDEILMCAGIIERAVQCHVPLTVVMATNGDYGCDHLSVGRARLYETLDGLNMLGVDREQVVFLGYADTGMPKEESFLYGLYHETDGERIHPSHCGTCTYGLPEKDEFHKSEYGEHGSYTRNGFVNDLKAVLRKYRPESIFTTSLEDTHGDHCGLFLFVREVFADCAEEGYEPELYCGLVHSGAGDENWPARGRVESLKEPVGPDSDHRPEVFNWEDRIVFPVPDSMLSENLAENKKAAALAKHVTALKPDAEEFLYAFVKTDEVFWEIRDHNLADDFASGKGVR